MQFTISHNNTTSSVVNVCIQQRTVL